MIYLLKMMSGNEIAIESEAEVENLLRQANAGAKLVVTKHGIVNIASIDSIVKNKEVMKEISQQLRYGKTESMAIRDVLGNSPFAKLLGEKMKISDGIRTAAQEDGARGERLGK